jgi:hypothetical protein
MEKIKQFIGSEKGKDILTVIIVILVGLGSFELGRLSKENGSSGIQIEYPDQNNDQPATVVSAGSYSDISENTAPSSLNQNISGKNYFASSRGSKYYTLGCSAGKTIKQENRVYFTTADEAEKAGYSLSAACN